MREEGGPAPGSRPPAGGEPEVHPGGGAGDHHHSAAGLRGLVARLLQTHPHAPAGSLDDVLADPAEGIRAVKVSLLILGLTALLQLLVALVSGSVALLADTIHNAGDALTAVPLWVAFTLGKRPPNRRHSYGYGRAEDLAGLFVLAMIALSAALVAWESVAKLLHPSPIAHLAWVAGAAVLGFLGNEAVARYRIRVGERLGSAALVADGHHARADAFTSLSVLAGAGGAALGWPQADSLVGLGIGLVILLILRDAGGQLWPRLMDAVDPAVLERAQAAARSADGVEQVTALRARWIGHTMHAEAHVTANCELTLNEAHAVAERARHAMLHGVPRLSSVTVHVDPCGHDGHDPHAELEHHDASSQGR